MQHGTTVIALHGDWMSGETLRRDMGNPDWCDLYPNWKKQDYWPFRDWLDSNFERIILACYSRGGSEAATLTHHLRNIAGTILYESPMLAVDRPRCDFPVLWIQNDRSRYRNTREMVDTRKQWKRACTDFTPLKGSGRHIKWFPPGHAWDKALNTEIGQWVSQVKGLG